MIIVDWYHIPTAISLTFIALVLVVSILLSLRKSSAPGAGGEVHPAHD